MGGGAVCVLAVVALLNCRGVCGTCCPKPLCHAHWPVDRTLAREGNDREVGLGLTAGSRQGQLANGPQTELSQQEVRGLPGQSARQCDSDGKMSTWLSAKAWKPPRDNSGLVTF